MSSDTQAVLSILPMAAATYFALAVWGPVLAARQLKGTANRMYRREWLALPVPFVLWAAWYLLTGGRGKTVLNVYLEPLLLGLIVTGTYAALRFALAHIFGPRNLRLVPFLTICGAAVLIACFAPALYE